MGEALHMYGIKLHFNGRTASLLYSADHKHSHNANIKWPLDTGAQAAIAYFTTAISIPGKQRVNS